MDLIIHKSEIDGVITAPPSKSYTIRALMCAALAKGESKIHDPLRCRDTDTAVSVLRDVGIRISRVSQEHWVVSGGDLRKPKEPLDCRDSGLTLRLMTALCTQVSGGCKLVYPHDRPMKELVDHLNLLGASCSYSPGMIAVEGRKPEGGGMIIKSPVSSQFVSALLFIAPLMKNGLNLQVLGMRSGGYPLMTIDCMKKFGIEILSSGSIFNILRGEYTPAVFHVERDWSSSAPILALGAVGGKITVKGLDSRSFQGDTRVLKILHNLGARVKNRSYMVTITKGVLRGISVDVRHCIDLFPLLGALGTLTGVSLRGIKAARSKESNRVSAISENLVRVGAKVHETEDTLTIVPGIAHSPIINTYNDHRIAMAFAVPAAVTGGFLIKDAECVEKTYSGFWKDFEAIGGRYEQYTR